jgi:hypothetical protein
MTDHLEYIQDLDQRHLGSNTNCNGCCVHYMNVSVHQSSSTEDQSDLLHILGSLPQKTNLLGGNTLGL